MEKFALAKPIIKEAKALLVKVDPVTIRSQYELELNFIDLLYASNKVCNLCIIIFTCSQILSCRV